MGNAQISTTYQVTLKTLPMTVNSVNAISNGGKNNDLVSYSNLPVLSHGLGGADPLSYPVDVSLNRASSNQDEFNKQVQTNNIQAVIPLSAQPITPATPENSLIQQVVNLTNAQRQLAGLQPLQLNVQLNNSAQAHSEDMALRDFFSHTGSNGIGIGDRAKAVGYKYSYIGENIGAGQATAQDIVQGWMNSESHRAQILNPNYYEIGVGYYYLANDTGNVNYNHYWVVDFGKVM